MSGATACESGPGCPGIFFARRSGVRRAGAFVACRLLKKLGFIRFKSTLSSVGHMVIVDGAWDIRLAQCDRPEFIAFIAQLAARGKARG